MKRPRPVLALGACGLLVLGLGCSSRERELGARQGPGAPAAVLGRKLTPAGRTVLAPRWLDLDPLKLERALREVDAAVDAFSEAWGKGVEPAVVEIYPFGFQAFPSGDSLAAGTTRGAHVVVAWFTEPPHLLALAHELGHVAAPGWNHARMESDEAMVRAVAAARQRQQALE